MMNRMTGVVLEQEGTHVIVLTSTGEFKRIRCRGRLPEIGEEIFLKTNTYRPFVTKFSWIAAAAAILVLALMSPFAAMVNQPPEKAVAWITVDINPSLELTISNRERIISAIGLNNDGRKLLKRVDIIGMKPEEALIALTDEATNMGYIKQAKENNVVISVASADKGFNSQELEQKLVAATQDVLSEKRMAAVVQTVKVTPEFREKAKKKEISTGKYAVLIEAVNSGILISEDEIKDNSITDAIKKAGGKPEEILQKAHEEKVEQLPEKEKKYLMIAGRIDRNRSSNEEQGRDKPAATEDGKNTAGNNEDQTLTKDNPARENDTEKPGNEQGNSGAKPAEQNEKPATGGPGTQKPADTGNSTNNDSQRETNTTIIIDNNTRNRDNSMN
ncbi:anti-sigma factor domain-containing protein [Thermincola ferriacetica]